MAVRVLVADDDEHFRSALVALVSSDDGIRLVGSAEDADQALEIAAAEQPDVCLTDVKMPGGGGMRVAQEMGSVSPRTRVIALTAHEDQATVVEMLRAGADGYIVKGDASVDIIDAVHRVFRGASIVSSDVTGTIVSELSPRLREEAADLDRLRVVTERTRALLASGGPKTVWQPVMDISKGQPVAFEALSRFPGPPTPDAWFDEAAEVGLGVDLEIAAIRNALAQAVGADGFIVSLNASPGVLLSGALERVLLAGRQSIALEITEHVPVVDVSALHAALAPIREGGVLLALDDTGARYSVLERILDLAPDIMKLDIVLIRDIDADRSRRALAAALTTFAEAMGIAVVAEGVETEAELTAMRELGVNFAQGYHLGRPAEGFAAASPR